MHNLKYLLPSDLHVKHRKVSGALQLSTCADRGTQYRFTVRNFTINQCYHFPISRGGHIDLSSDSKNKSQSFLGFIFLNFDQTLPLPGFENPCNES